MSKCTFAQYGCGKMSEYTIRYATEKGCKLIGAFDIDESKLDKDVSIISKTKPMGVKIQHAAKLDEFLSKNKPDIVIVTTMSLINDVEDCLTICAKNGVNAITTCEEAFYPQNSNPKVFEKIDKLAKINGCTICGSGYQDVFWGNLITTLAGSSQKIIKISGKSSYNVEDYGIALARAHGAGLSPVEFENKIASADNITEKERRKLIMSGKFLPSYMWNVNGWLCSHLGLTIKSQTQKCVPQLAKNKLKSSTLKMEIPKGYARGMSAVVTTKTKEGIIIETECIGKVYTKEEFDSNIWTVVGEPATEIIVNRPATVELTCATVVNRIPEVIKSPSGFYTTEKMPVNKFKFNV